MKRMILLLLGAYCSVCMAQDALPEAGKFISDKPVGKGWINLLASFDDWKAEKEYWQLDKGVLHGEANLQKLHHYAWTNKSYADFELNVLIKMTGGETA